MIISTDQTGRIVYSPARPQRIISLVPSQTELLFELGLQKNVVGITRFCVHPKKISGAIARVGGTKKLHMDIIKQLGPDLIIANKEENTREEIEWLARDFPVWISNVADFESALEMIKSIGLLTHSVAEASLLISKIKSGFKGLEEFLTEIESEQMNLRTAYLIWQNPMMAAGNDNFIHSMIEKCGLVNIFSDQSRYPVTSIDEIAARNCELLILSSEPFPFAEKHETEFKALLKKTRIVLADGEMFSWYGSRMKLAPLYFISLLQQINR